MPTEVQTLHDPMSCTLRRHSLLHMAVDELLACYLASHAPGTPLPRVIELLKWNVEKATELDAGRVTL